MRHFRYYPRFEYCDDQAVNMMVRSKIRDVLQEEGALYYETTVRDGERADVISRKYYGTPDYAWVIFYANDIMNPLTEWVYFQEEFATLIEKKYGSVRAAQLSVHHYEVTDDNGQTYIIDERTYLSGQYTPSQLTVVSNYDYEDRLNEERRNIKVLDVIYLRQIVGELRSIFG